jgi:hypothetical protein
MFFSQVQVLFVSEAVGLLYIGQISASGLLSANGLFG